MDIKKEFEPSLNSRSVKELFESLIRGEAAFEPFRDLEGFVRFMEVRSEDSYALKDDCLLAIVRHVQSTVNPDAGLCLLTYLLAPGLQAILRDLVVRGNPLMEAWSDLWWAFFQTAMSYPVVRRTSKVAANLLLDTRHRVVKARRDEASLQRQFETLERQDSGDEPETRHPAWDRARTLIDKEDTAGLKDADLTILLGSRVYGLDLKEIAERLGISYEAARKRRQRIERMLRDRWSLED